MIRGFIRIQLKNGKGGSRRVPHGSTLEAFTHNSTDVSFGRNTKPFSISRGSIKRSRFSSLDPGKIEKGT